MKRQLCEHVDIEINKEATPPYVKVIRGVAVPAFGWSRKLEADTPRIKCSECGTMKVIRGYAVKMNRTHQLAHPRKEQPRGKTSARKRTHKQNKKTSRDEISWEFLD